MNDYPFIVVDDNNKTNYLGFDCLNDADNYMIECDGGHLYCLEGYGIYSDGHNEKYDTSIKGGKS